MINHHIQTLALTVLFFTVSISATMAQANPGKWQVGVNGGIMVYQGDLTASDVGSYKNAKASFGMYVSRVLNPSLLLRTNLAFGKLTGDDSRYSSPVYRQQRNYKFSTPVTEVSELLVWNMLGNNNNQYGHRFSPYAFTGVGVSFLRINRDTSQFNTHYFASYTNLVNGLRTDMSRATPRAALVVPMGLGMEYFLMPKLSLIAEFNFRYTFTDYLDGFSLGANPDKKDFYHSNTIGLLYRFGGSNRLGCPPVKR